MLPANQIAGFLNFNILKIIGSIKLIFVHAGTCLLKLQVDDVILGGCGQACLKRLLKISGCPFSCNLFFSFFNSFFSFSLLIHLLACRGKKSKILEKNSGEGQIFFWFCRKALWYEFWGEEKLHNAVSKITNLISFKMFDMC